jgi:hypothetical protein
MDSDPEAGYTGTTPNGRERVAHAGADRITEDKDI